MMAEHFQQIGFTRSCQILRKGLICIENSKYIFCSYLLFGKKHFGATHSGEIPFDVTDSRNVTLKMPATVEIR